MDVGCVAQHIHLLRKEQAHAIAQGQYWLAEDARIARKSIETSPSELGTILASRLPTHQLFVHGKRLAKLNGNSHLGVPPALLE